MQPEQDHAEEQCLERALEVARLEQRRTEFEEFRQGQREFIVRLAELLRQIDAQLQLLWSLKSEDIAGITPQMRRQIAMQKDLLDKYREMLVQRLHAMGWEGLEATRTFRRTTQLIQEAKFAAAHPQFSGYFSRQAKLRAKLPTLKAAAMAAREL